MPAGQVKIIYTADEKDAARGTAKLIRMYQQLDSEAKKMRKEMREAGRAGKKAMDGTGTAAKSTGKKTGAARGEMQLFSTAAKSAAASVKTWVAGFVGISGILAAMRGLVGEMREVRDLQKEMFGQTVTSEELALKSASLFGDVSPQKLKEMENQQIRLAAKYRITKDLAARIQFTSISALGTGPAANASMESTAMFAGAQKLTADEVKNLPKYYKVTGALTKEDQLKLLGGLYGGTKGSIVETGEVIDPLMTLLPPGMERGFTHQQLLAKHMGLIETLNPVRAARAALILQEVTGGKTEKAQKWFGKLAKERGEDWGAMRGPERLEFARRHYHEIEGDTKKEDEMTVALGGAKGTRILRYAFSEAVEKQEAFTLRKIKEGETSGVIEKMHGDYIKSNIALSNLQTLEKQTVGAATGRKKAKAVDFDSQVKLIHSQARANMKPGSGMWFMMRGKEYEQRAVARAYAEAGLTGVQPDSPDYEEAQTLRDNTPTTFTTGSKWLTDWSRVTKRGYTARYGTVNLPQRLWQEPGETPSLIGSTPGPAPVTQHPHLGAGFEALFEAQDKMQEQTDVQKETLEVLKSIDAKLGAGGGGAAGDRMGPPYWPSGNGDQ